MTPPPFSYPEVPLHELLRASCRRSPEKAAVIFEDRAISYAQLEARANRLAQALRASGVQRGDRVIVSTYNRPEFLECFYAVSMAGGVITPMNPSYKPEEIAHQITNAEACLALLEAPVYARLAGVRAAASCLKQVVAIGAEPQAGDAAYEDFLAAFPPEAPPEVSLNISEDLAALIYSSGTMGRPRGVMMTHRNLVCSHFQYIYAGQLTAEDRSLIFLPFVHVYGLMLLNGMIAAGGTQVLLHRYNLEQTLELVQRHKVTLYYTTTSVLIKMGQFPRLGEYDLSSVRYINSGGAPLPVEVRRRIRDLTGLPVADGYGMTEAPLVGSFVPAEERRIVDEETGTVELPAGQPGELIIRGDHVMRGYWRDPEATAAVLRDGWLHTGDIAYLDAKGHLRLAGRKKEMIKYKGFAISPSEIEGVLLDHPDVSDCAVVGVPDAEAGEVPKAFIVPKAGARLDAAALRGYLRERLAEYKQVRAFQFVDSIPRNHYGKILRRVLS